MVNSGDISMSFALLMRCTLMQVFFVDPVIIEFDVNS